MTTKRCSTKRSSTPSTQRDSGSIFMEALRKLTPAGVARMEAAVHPLLRHMAGHCSENLLELLEEFGKAAAAARAGDARACSAAMRAMDRASERANPVLTAEMERLGITVDYLAAALLSTPVVAPLPTQAHVVRF